jgi:hypothetical protein
MKTIFGKIIVFLGIGAFTFFVGNMEHAKADVVSINPTKDNTLYESMSGAQSNGVGIYFFAGRTRAGELRRGVIAFDIAGNIPAGSTINSVTLTLQMSKTRTAANRNIELHKLLADWGEGTSDASGEEGTGTAATTNDATWIHRFFDSTLWTDVGGDFSATVSATIAVGGLGSYTWGSTAQIVTDVQEWLDMPSVNLGWLLLGNESRNSTAKRFDTKEHGTMANRPVLTIDYTPGVTSRMFFGVSPACAGVGEMVTITVDRTFGGQLYRYFVQPPGETFQMIQDWTVVKTINWTPGQPGIHIVVVQVSDNINDPAPLRQMGGTYDVGGTECPHPVQVTLSPASGVVNETVTITVMAEGSNLMYRFFVRSGDFRPPSQPGSFMPMGDWTANNAFEFTPDTANIFTLIVQVTSDAMNPGSEIPPKPQAGTVYVVGQ